MRILTWHGKYGPISYDASTDELLEGAARKILEEMVRDGWIYEPTAYEPDEEDAEIIALSEEEVAALPAGLRLKAERTRAYSAERQKEHEADREQYDRAQRILAGEARWVCARRKDDVKPELYARILEAATTRWFGPVEEREDGIYKPETAWELLQERDGAEYEDFRLTSVGSHSIEKW